MDKTEPRKGTNRRKIQPTTDKIANRKLEIMDGFMRRKEQSKEDIRKLPESFSANSESGKSV